MGSNPAGITSEEGGGRGIAVYRITMSQPPEIRNRSGVTIRMTKPYPPEIRNRRRRDLDYNDTSGKMKEGLHGQSLFLCGFRSGAAGDGLLSVCFGYPMNIDKPSHFNRSSG